MSNKIDKDHHCTWEGEYDKYLSAVGYFLEHWDDMPDQNTYTRRRLGKI